MIELLEALLWFMLYDSTRIDRMNEREFNQYCYDRDQKILKLWKPTLDMLDRLKTQKRIEEAHERNEP